MVFLKYSAEWKKHALKEKLQFEMLLTIGQKFH